MFNKDFVWGAATASYQIEGAAYEDGKGLNVWDVFCKQEGRVFKGNNGDTACDHYHRMEEDVELMAQMGLKAYRFSISWARILPDGIGKVNESGIAFYDRLINKLLEKGITPYITLFHWDYPYSLHLRGGWLNPESSDWFEEYARLIAERFGDRVAHYITLNEPEVFIGRGYRDGDFAPGMKHHRDELLIMGHNVLKAHGKAVRALREHCKLKTEIGVSIACAPALPLTEKDEDAAMKAFVWANLDTFVYSETYWLDPMVLGRYPDCIQQYADEHKMGFTAEDMAIINQPLDFAAANIYEGNYFTTGENGEPVPVDLQAGYPTTHNGWKFSPEALYWGPRQYCTRYGLPYYITENGTSLGDFIMSDGEVHDTYRVEYMKQYLSQLERAHDEGYPVKGYFAWSLFDNFEWVLGYSERFGLVYVDFQTQKRTLKDSAKWYTEYIKEKTKGE